MTISDFGRRPYSNSSAGTDHGTATMHFLIGDPVAGGDLTRLRRTGRHLDGLTEHRQSARQGQTVHGGLLKADATILRLRCNTRRRPDLDSLAQPT